MLFFFSSYGMTTARMQLKRDEIASEPEVYLFGSGRRAPGYIKEKYDKSMVVTYEI